MDLLLAAGYDSSSSSSSSEPSKKNASLREGNVQNALHGHTPNNSPRLGHNDDSSPSTADGNAAKKRGLHQSSRSPAATKKRKLARSSITIAKNYDTDWQQSDQSFERSNPHWEGRWAGHIYLPFPNLDPCDNDASALDEKFNDETDSNILAEKDSDSDSNESNVSSMEEEYLQTLRSFLSASRTLIHYWTALIDEGCIDCDDTGSKRVIVPHVSMSPKKTKPESKTATNQVIQNNNTYLHISLSRPIYLPAPSVDSFLADISSSLAPMTRISHNGKTIHLRPHDATIFINDNHTRSFLSIPISEESSRWVKRLLLPPIDAAMLRFGQKKYYDEGIMHVSIASVKGNIIPIILKKRRNGDPKQSTSGSESKFNSIPLFQIQGCSKLADETRNDIPESIPIRLDRIQCDFGKVKNVVLPL